jgi:transposase
MDGAAWHRGDKLKKWENIVPLFQPPYSPQVNPIESLDEHPRKITIIYHRPTCHNDIMDTGYF